MKKYIVTEITSSDNFQTGVPIELEGIKVFGSQEEAQKYLKKEYKEQCKRAETFGHLEDSDIDDTFCEVVCLNDDETLTYNAEITEVDIPITEFDLCYEKLAECLPDADESTLTEKANAMANDDAVWVPFDESLAYHTED